MMIVMNNAAPAPADVAEITAPGLWEPPAPVRVRGTVAVLAGAAETPRVYERFGRRISAEGYVVGVFEAADAGHATAWLSEQEVAPRVLIGSDAGSLAVLAALAAAATADGAVVAGTPLQSEFAADPAARTACPVHLGVLGEGSARSSRDVAIAPATAAQLASIEVPVLAVHGTADSVSPFADAVRYLGALPHLRIVETVGGLHDALNDTSHRSVAARIVLWLEDLRAGAVITREVAA